MEKITREAAFERKLKFFFTDKPCRKGHLSQRYVSTGACVRCQSRHSASYRGGNGDPDIRTVSYDVHVDDLPTLRATVDALRIGRGWMPLGGPLDPNPPPLRRTTPEEIQAARRRIFGHVLASVEAQPISGPSEWTGGVLK